MRAALCALVLGLAVQMPQTAQACAPDTPACETALGSYHIRLPDSPAPATGYPSVIFLHGAGGTSDGVFRLSSMVESFRSRGYAVIAPQGLPWRSGRGGIWSFLPETSHPSRPRARDEAAFFDTILQDARARHGIAQAPGLLAGFSAGGFMVNYLACETPERFNAYAPLAGGFWRPHPEACAGPVRLFHTHGWQDGTVPLEGRPLGSRFLQGDILEGMTIWRAANDCARPNPTSYATTGAFMRRKWACAPGSALELALFPGGHGVPNGWADMILDWYEALPAR